MTFKHLMVKRNLELELAEIESLLCEEGGKEEGVGGLQEEEVEDVPEPLTPEEEEAHLEMYVTSVRPIDSHAIFSYTNINHGY